MREKVLQRKIPKHEDNIVDFRTILGILLSFPSREEDGTYKVLEGIIWHD